MADAVTLVRGDTGAAADTALVVRAPLAIASAGRQGGGAAVAGQRCAVLHSVPHHVVDG
eukprot:COSAG04_NODE_23475_length_338_cov_0.493724_1_plen_58_part_10